MAAASPEHPAKRYLQEHGEVHLSALGIAVSGAVTVAEILKNRNLAVEKKLGTSLEVLGDEFRTRQKPKMEILLTKSPQFDEIIAAEQAAAAAGEGHDEEEEEEGDAADHGQ
ncbi:hypothetical protein N2152v2_009634 [Parachlorella kessleri]